MAATSVTCRALVLLRLEITRGLSVASLATPRRYHNETWCKRWWHISQRGLSTTRGTFGPTISPILSKEQKESKDTKSQHQNQHQQQKPLKDSKNEKDPNEPDSTTLIGVTIDFHRGYPRITVPLPSRKEKCIFTLKPITNTVGDFIHMLKEEDRGIDRACITTLDGVRICSHNTIESLLDNDFRLVINDVTYDVSPPEKEKYSMETMQKLSDIQVTVSQLYETLQCTEYNSVLEREVIAELEQVMIELEPLELKKQTLEVAAERRANLHSWIGLVAMAVQFGILARLTWWEYSWDIMEPVTYFVTYATGMLCYIYFIVTRQEYMLPDVMNRRYLIALHKRAKAVGLDLTRYNMLKDQAYELETTLKIIRGPLWNHKNKIEKKLRDKTRSSSSSSSSSSSRSPSPSPCPSPEKTVRT
ncbi:calcium uniporter protein, mitochondrial isoform X2 [Microplitis mediator]|uniref:calcium uniporter protein, mitochondrial isoform X2 n=1 Tax=Microplitis mediator TaxID=375433 RepID=UPI0025558F49|nr:calcium uniporter protein, mitochondrial isoform X2 [Microplitis mediator]